MTFPGPHSNDNDQDPAVPGPGAAADSGLAERLRAIGLGEVGGSEDGQGGTEGPLTRLTGQGPTTSRGLAALGAELRTLTAGLAAQGDQLRDAERSLVDRIADVDDDRRRTQGQLQRAMQSQYDEVDARLRRQGGLITLGLILIAALAAGGFFLLHQMQQQRIGELQGDLMGEVQTLGVELGRLKGLAAQETQVQEKLAALTAALDQVSAELGQTKSAPRTEAPASIPDVAPLVEQVTRLKLDQQGLVNEIDALRKALAAATAAPPGRSDQDKTEAIGQTPKAEATAEAANPQVEPPGVPGSYPGAAGEWGARAPSPEPTAPATEFPASPGQASTSERPFALQLIGSYDRAAVLDLAARSDLPDSVFLRQETLRGRPWFVLIHSLHRNHAEAEAERGRLPADLARLDTWIRKLAPDAMLEPIRTGPAP
jgi:DamX protein